MAGDTTNDHYVNNFDEEADLFIFSLLSVLQPKREIITDVGPTVFSDGRRLWNIGPKTTRHLATYVGKYVFMPGEELTITCNHGVTGTIEAREIKENGSLRRKSKKKTS